MRKDIEIREAVHRWTRGHLRLRSSFYTGRGVNLGDLNSIYLEEIYQGLQSEVGPKAATNFVRLVNNLKDLTASGFIQAFEHFWYSGCESTAPTIPAGAGNHLSGHGEARIGEAFALLGATLSGSISSPEVIEARSVAVKDLFLRRHKREIE